MLNQLTLDNIDELNELQSIFYEVFKQKNELINTLSNNPYVKIYTYSVDKKVVAFIQYEYIYDRFELDNIFVLDNYRRQGIASILIEFMIREGLNKKISNITLEVRQNNTQAINLYKKYGFIEKSIRKNYYGHDNGILMEKEMI